MKSESEIEILVKLLIQLKELLNDFLELSKKKPNDSVNNFKLKLVNKILATANGIIDEQNRPFDDFDSFDGNDLPSNSDVVLILTQYYSCLRKFGREQTKYSRWVINGKDSNIEADMDLLY